MKISFFAIPALLVTAAPAFAQAMTAQQYVATAGASDLYERTASEIVLESTQNPGIRSFATMMVADHGKSTDQVKAAAARTRLRVAPPQLTPAQQEMIAQLRAERGPARDAAYLAQQRAAHGQALSVQKAYAEGGRVASLRQAAAGIVPVVEHHIMMLKAM